MTSEKTEKRWEVIGEWEKDVTKGYQFAKIGLIKEVHIGWHANGGTISILRFGIRMTIVLADTGFENHFDMAFKELEEFSKEVGFRNMDDLKGLPVLCLLNSEAINASVEKMVPHYRLMKAFEEDKK